MSDAERLPIDALQDLERLVLQEPQFNGRIELDKAVVLKLIRGAVAAERELERINAIPRPV